MYDLVSRLTIAIIKVSNISATLSRRGGLPRFLSWLGFQKFVQIFDLVNRFNQSDHELQGALHGRRRRRANQARVQEAVFRVIYIYIRANFGIISNCRFICIVHLECV